MILTEQQAEAESIGAINQIAEPEKPIDFSYGAQLGAAFRTQNTIGSAIQSFGQLNKPPKIGYNALSDENMKGYEAYALSFIDVDTPEESYAVKSRIDREQQDASMLTGFSGLTAQIIAGVVDPINFIPFIGTASKGVTVGKTALKTATAGTLSATAAELSLQSTQVSRSEEESAYNIAGATLIAGVLGGASVLVRDALTPLAEKAKLEVTPPPLDEPDYLAPNSIELKSVGAAAVEQGESKIKSALGFEKIVKFSSPMSRTALSPNVQTRRSMQSLVENPYYYADNVEGKGVIAVETKTKAWNANYATAVQGSDNFFKEYKKAGGELSLKEFKENVGYAMRRNDVSDIPEVTKAAQSWRKNLFDPLKDAAIEAKLLPENVSVDTALSYLTRVYDTNRIIAQRNVFKTRVEAWLKQTSPDVADESSLIADDIIDHILGTTEGRIGYTPVPMKRGPLKERVFNIPDDKIEDFLFSDIETVSRFYLRTMAPDVELASRFGDVDMKSEISKITDEANAEINAATTEKERIKLKKQMDEDIRDIEAMRDRLRGTYGMPSDPSSFLVRGARLIRNENYISMLGSMTLSSLADLARPIMVHGVTRTLTRGLLPMISNWKQFKLATNEAKLAGAALDMIIDSRAMALADIGDTYGRNTKFERAVEYAAEKFGKVALMTPWNAALKQFSSVITQNNILQAVTKGVDAEKLARNGIGKDVAAKIAEEFKLHGTKGDVWVANTQKWTDRDAIEAFRSAVLKEVDNTIITPGIGDKPLWTSSETGKLISQFKTFALASTQRVTITALQQRDMATLNGTLLSIALGMMTYKIRNDMVGREVSDNPAVWVREGVDRSGILGWIYEANNITEKLTRGTVGINRLTGGEISSRYASRNLMGTVLGPTFGKVEDIATTTGAISTGEATEADVRAMRRLIPYQNVFYLRGLFDKLEEEANP